jgi:hypothetical protein
MRSNNSTVFKRESNSLLNTVEFFLIAVFFGVHFYGQTLGTYLHHTVSMVGVTDPGISGSWLG